MLQDIANDDFLCVIVSQKTQTETIYERENTITDIAYILNESEFCNVEVIK